MNTIPTIQQINGDSLGGSQDSVKRQWLEFHSPSQCRDWVMPDGFKLVGDFHVTRGSITVIGGPPGLGKSRAAMQLAKSGGEGSKWFGLDVHSPFKTLYLQNENGPHRLKADFKSFPEELDGQMLITPPPEYGMRFDVDEFRNELYERMMDYKPGVIVIDPFTNIVNDSTQGDYSAAFDFIRDCLPGGDDAPAIVIVAHTRKPKSTEKPQGTELLYELLGSTKLGAMARVVFVMQPATSDTEDNRVVWTCCKNNDGEKGGRTAWTREDGFFSQCGQFDWNEFSTPSKGNQVISIEDVKGLFNGRLGAKRGILVEELQENTKCSQAAAYNALDLTGRFGNHLSINEDKLISWVD